MLHVSQHRFCVRFIVLTVIFLNILTFVYVSFDSNYIKQLSGSYDKTACIRIESFNPTEVPVNRSIFFIETNRLAAVKLSPRQVCSIESAARIHPDRLVYVLFLSPKFNCQYDITAVFTLMSNYQNVRFRYIELLKYTQNTPIEGFVRSGKMEKSRWPVEKRSDMLRILTLWKFGGIYMDLDMISLKPIPLINFIGAQYPGDLLASSVIGFQNKNIAEIAIHMFENGWNGEDWDNTGPTLLTDLAKKLCGTNDVPSMYSIQSTCKNLIIYPPDVFGPIAWYDWEVFFDSSQIKFVKEKMYNSLAVHFWNKMTKNQFIIPTSRQPYTDIASSNCPKVFSTVIDYF